MKRSQLVEILNKLPAGDVYSVKGSDILVEKRT